MYGSLSRRLVVVHVTLGMEEVIYVSNIGNRDIYPTNSVTSFKNNITPPIYLNPDIAYEIGLHNIYYPPHYLDIPRNNLDYRVEIWVPVGKVPNDIFMLHTFVSHLDIEVGDMDFFIRSLNRILVRNYQTVFSEAYTYYFPSRNNDIILSWDGENNRTLIRTTPAEDCGEKLLTTLGLHCHLYMKFGRRIAEVLGVNEGESYHIFGNDRVRDDYIIAPKAPHPGGGVDFGVFTTGEAGNRYLPMTVYKPLNTTVLDCISISITDQSHDAINFSSGRTVTLVLHIRPKF